MIYRQTRTRESLLGALSSGGPRPTVSVIVPCFNYGHFLDGCVSSVLAQEGVDVRVLVIDDCSSDGSADVCRRLAAADSRVEFRRHGENVGLIATANEGLEWADQEYVVLLSSDDQLVPGSLARATAVMTARADVGMVYGRPLLAIEGRPLPRANGRWRSTKVWSGTQWLALRCRSGQNCISSPEVVVRTAVQRLVGGYDQSCYHTSDLNMWLRIAAVSDVAYVRGVPQAVYRIHANSMLRGQEGPLEDLCERRAAFTSFFESLAPQFPGAEKLKATVARALARQGLWRASRLVDRGLADDLVDELAAFALDVCPEARSLREWRGLVLRRWIGAGRSLRFLPFIATGAGHRLHSHATWMRWRFTGT